MKKPSKTTKTSGTKPFKDSVVFFGSGPVAAESLNLLLDQFEIEAVITKPRLPHHRGDTPVVDLCVERGLAFYTPANKQELSELFTTISLDSQIGVVIDYGIIINNDVIEFFTLGIVNSHFSLLPEWRGADPISFSILSGQPKTGVSLMIIEPTLDTGKLIAQKSMPIDPDDTTPSLTTKLIRLSDKLLGDYLPGYISGNITPRRQPHPNRATYSRKLTKDDGVLDWSKPAEQLEREIRAFIDWPKSRTTLAGKDVVITQAHATPTVGADQKPGDITVVPETKTLGIATSSGTLWIDRLKPAGKNEMTGEAFLAGHRNQL
ncbi:methionyl-tRNA formyltransferase [Candidatus Saccharibacteria bacterium]|nr:methionyl-tRNA formyltransferase [Candidatus Saccharibacteria bacterium]